VLLYRANKWSNFLFHLSDNKKNIPTFVFMITEECGESDRLEKKGMSLSEGGVWEQKA
jgi:hypothetical protein